MSPEGLEYASKKYIEALKHQVNVAKAFYFGRLAEGIAGLMGLPEDVRRDIDFFIDMEAGGQLVDPLDKDSQWLIAAAIMTSVKKRMGMYE